MAFALEFGTLPVSSRDTRSLVSSFLQKGYALSRWRDAWQRGCRRREAMV
jgi:hypothetical protein